MKVNLTNYSGKVDKQAIIRSNDPANPQQTLRIHGVVRAIIDVKPSTNVLFNGMAEQLSESVLNLVATDTPFRITGIQSNLKEDISYSLETVTEGKHYRLKVANKLHYGNYGGFIKLTTNLARQPNILIHVLGFIAGEITVRPQNLLIGKLGSGLPERVGKVTVVSNRKKPFNITGLTYDRNLLSVSQEKLANQEGFTLQVQPRLEGVPPGTRKQTTLKIDTDISHGQKTEVLISVFNYPGPAGSRHK